MPRKQTDRARQPDRADSTSVSSLMKIISHLPLQVHKQLPIIKDGCDSLRACGLQLGLSQVFYACAVLKSFVWHSFQPRGPNICQFILHFLMNFLGLVAFIIWWLRLALDTAGSILGTDPAFKPKLCFMRSSRCMMSQTVTQGDGVGYVSSLMPSTTRCK